MTNKTSKTGFVVVEDGAVNCGALYTWMRCQDRDEETLGRVLRGLVKEEDQPAGPTKRVALARAAAKVASVLKLEHDKTRDGWALLRESTVEGRLVKTEVAHVSLMGDAPAVDIFAEDLLAEGEDIRATVRAAFSTALRTVTGADLGEWIGGLFGSHDGILVRATGGFWYVPHGQDEKVAEITRALEDAGAATVYRIPAMRSTDTLRAVMASLKGEVEAGAAEIAAWVAEQEARIEAGEVTKERSRDLRLVRIDEVLGKVSRYRDALRVDVVEIQDQLEALAQRVKILRTEGDAAAAGRIVHGGDRALLDLEDKPSTSVAEDLGAPRGPLDL